MVERRRVVFPEPGEDIRFSRNTPCSFSPLQRASACRVVIGKHAGFDLNDFIGHTAPHVFG